MNILLTRILVAFGLVSFFKGTFEDFKVHAKESSSSSSSADRSETMGGRTGGCSRCN